ncbi:hypothetical protein NW754_004413 [Fusarium falciforme]|nr:hypothetical protein NW754_004413 [Fusarium falciforme]
MTDSDVTGVWIDGQSHNRTAGVLTQLKLAQGRIESLWPHQNGVKVVVTLDVMFDQEALRVEILPDITVASARQQATVWERSESSDLRTWQWVKRHTGACLGDWCRWWRIKMASFPAAEEDNGCDQKQYQAGDRDSRSCPNPGTDSS